MKKKEYDFGLIIGGVSEITDDVTDALFKSGCDDATFGMRSGVLLAEFSRQAVSLKDAILSAIHDIRAAKIGAAIWRVNQSDLVSPTEIAKQIKKSRQFVFNYIKGVRGVGDFPPPECYLDDKHPLWAWSAVSAWMVKRNILKPEEHSNAAVIAVINNSLESARQRKNDPKLFKEIAAAVR